MTTDRPTDRQGGREMNWEITRRYYIRVPDRRSDEYYDILQAINRVDQLWFPYEDWQKDIEDGVLTSDAAGEAEEELVALWMSKEYERDGKFAEYIKTEDDSELLGE